MYQSVNKHIQNESFKIDPYYQSQKLKREVRQKSSSKAIVPLLSLLTVENKWEVQKRLNQIYGVLNRDQITKLTIPNITFQSLNALRQFWKKNHMHSLVLLSLSDSLNPLELKKRRHLAKKKKTLHVGREKPIIRAGLWSNLKSLGVKNPSRYLESRVFLIFTTAEYTQGSLFIIYYTLFWKTLNNLFQTTPLLYLNYRRSPIWSQNLPHFLTFYKQLSISDWCYFKGVSNVASTYLHRTTSFTYLRSRILIPYKHKDRVVITKPHYLAKRSHYDNLLNNLSIERSSLLNLTPLYFCYYFFIEMLMYYVRRSDKRPLYSSILTNSFIVNRKLLFLKGTSSTFSHKYTLSPRLISRSPIRAGLKSFFTLGVYDNTLETSFDNWLALSTTSSKVQNLLNWVLSRYQLIVPSAGNVYFYDQRIFGKLKSFLEAHSTGGYSFLTISLLDLTAFVKHATHVAIQTLMKYIYWNTYYQRDLLNFRRSLTNFFSLLWRSETQLHSTQFSTPNLAWNILPLKYFNYTLRRKFIKVVINRKYLPSTSLYFYNTLVTFMEFYTGRRVYLKFNPFIENSLSYNDLSRCYLWYNRVVGFQKLLGHRIFLYESLKIIHLALRFRDPMFLVNWIKIMLYRMSFWKYRLLFRYVKYVLQNLFYLYFTEFNFKGFKLLLKGKISVAGNARTRKLVFLIGETSHSKINNRILSHSTKIHSFTGVMGFKISFFY